MLRTLTKHGNTYALMIGKEVMRELQINQDTPLDVAVVDGALVITPQVDRPATDRELQDAMVFANAHFADVFKALAQ